MGLRGDLGGFEGKDNRGGRPHVGSVERGGAPEKERETPDASEGVGEAASLVLPTRERWRREGSTDFLPELLLGTEFGAVEDRLIVRCREANVELNSLEDEAIGPDTDLLEDTTESRLEHRFGMGGTFWDTFLLDAEG